MTETNLALIGGTLAAACVCLNPGLLRSRAWRATVTPLASIIGSGFLVAGPILADTAGERAWILMAALCAAGYLFGAAIRHNIVNIEPRLDRLTRAEARIERLSDLMLALSYFISVAFYLNLFAAFGLRILGIEDTIAIRSVATFSILTIGLIGFRGGLGALERMELGTVGIKLSAIGGLLLALILAFGGVTGDFELISVAGKRDAVDALRIGLGLVILVQGFETSRYLGGEYDTELRVRTMRHAQLISSAIYILFVFLTTHLFKSDLSQAGAETEIIDMLRPLGSVIVPLLIGAALASQSSAAIADMNGAGGLLNEASRRVLSIRFGNLITAMVAVAITWSANLFQIMTYASKAFVAYYALQSIQAARSAYLRENYAQAAMFASAVVLAVVVLLWAVPAGV